MEAWALGSGFEMVTADIPYLNLQWHRRYYDFGQFEMQVPADVYDPHWHYVHLRDRPEVGLAQKVEYSNDGGERLVTVSGFFAEKMLDQVCAFPRFVADKSRTETVAHALFDTYDVKGKTGIYGFFFDELGDRTQCDFLGDRLGTKLHSMLETRGLSFRVEPYVPTYGREALAMSVYQGKDRTQAQSANAWAVFSTSFGNVENESVSIDDSAYANACLVSANDEALQFEVDNSGGGERFEVFLDKNSEKPQDGQSAADFRAALEQAAAEKLQECSRVVEVDLDNYGSTGYMTDFDLGDLVTLQVEDVGLDLDARIVEVSEVFKPSGHTVSLGFGSKRITNLERALKA